MKNKAKNIVLILRSGGDFKFTDVYLLATHINKYWRDEIGANIYCYTDLVNEERSVVGLTIRPMPNRDWKGWWSKMNLFSPELKDLRPFLYLDLDTAVIGNVANLIPKEKNVTSFITLEDFYRKNRLASGVMYVPDTAYIDKLYKIWQKDPEKIMKEFRGDQDFIESVVKADEFWQKKFAPDVVTTFKPRIAGKITHRKEIPNNSKIICFHGKPRIPQAATTVDWVKRYMNYEV